MNKSVLTITPETLIISDTHFFHANIALYCFRPDGWQEQIVANWKRMLGPDEQILHLGDLALGKREYLAELMPSLPGKVFLIRGNHDKFPTYFYNGLGITIMPAEIDCVIGDRWIRFTHAALPEDRLLEGVMNFKPGSGTLQEWNEKHIQAIYLMMNGRLLPHT
jgi:predicted phosphodiesterase